MIECAEDTPMTLPLDLKQTAFSAWEKARGDIFGPGVLKLIPPICNPKCRYSIAG